MPIGQDACKVGGGGGGGRIGMEWRVGRGNLSTLLSLIPGTLLRLLKNIHLCLQGI